MTDTLDSQYMSTFLDLLKQAKLSLIVPTCQVGNLILLRATDNALNTHSLA